MRDWRSVTPYALIGAGMVAVAVAVTLVLNPFQHSGDGLGFSPPTMPATPTAGDPSPSGRSSPAASPTSPSPDPSGIASTVDAALAGAGAALTRDTAAGGAGRPGSTTSTRVTAQGTPRVTSAPSRAAARAPLGSGSPATSSTSRSATATPTMGGAGPVLGTGRIRFGTAYTGDATFYDATGAGNCSYEAGGDLMVVAMNQVDYENSQACGAYLRVSGPKGSVTVKVVDRCPECAVGALDLSAQAFARIADPVAGVVKVTWSLLSPALSGAVTVRYKEGSSPYWCAVQIRNHRNPVRTVEARIGSTWRALPRQEHNYFDSDKGAGCGGPMRVTDIYGNRVTVEVPLTVGRVQPGTAQFPPPA